MGNGGHRRETSDDAQAFHFSTGVFREHERTQYITEQRLAAAYTALRRHTSSHVPISTIAFDCGFSDISHFNRVFRRHFGCTPTEARESARSKHRP